MRSADEQLPERYEEIVRRLTQTVEKLESGGLPLEEALVAFEQGVRLARAGQERLDAAEKRVELLLEGDRTQAFEPPRNEKAPARPVRGRSGPDGDDIPY